MLSSDIQTLASLLAKLPVSKQGFADSLITQYKRKGSLSPKQIPYVKSLIELASNPTAKPAMAVSEVGELGKLLALFATARKHLKYPKIVISDSEVTYTLYVAGERSKNPGYVNITDGGGYGNNVWFGRISPNGNFEASRYGSERGSKLTQLLADLAFNPADTARKHGILTGRCCFCNRKLTDVRSTAAGFGATCAEHYGLLPSLSVMR